MTRSPAREEVGSAWRELLESRRHRAPTRVLPAALEALRREIGADAVALFRLGSESTERIAAAGGDAPSEIALDATPGGWLEFDSELGLLVDPPESVARVGEAQRFAVATAWRNDALEARLKRETFQFAQRGVELEALYDVGLAIASMLDAEALGDEILLRAVSLLDARRGALYLASGSGYSLAQTLGGDAIDRLDETVAEGLLEGRCAPEEAKATLPGSEHTYAVPIEADGVRRGLLVVADKESRRGIGPFEEADGRTLSLFANQAGIALQNAYLYRQALEKKKLESELELASDIQRRLLPTELPKLEGWQVAGWNRPARHVGGDYYDIREHDGGLVFVLADVSGKGMPAALLVSTLHSALRLLMAREPLTGSLLERLNAHIYESSAPNKFITLFAARLDPEAGRLEYLNAGHNPAFHVRRGGAVEPLASCGLPIGMLAAGRFQRSEVVLDPGDLVCVYSDGITECERPAGDDFGEQRLSELLVGHRAAPLDELVRTIDGTTQDFAAGAPQADDQTLVLVRRTPT